MGDLPIKLGLSVSLNPDAQAIDRTVCIIVSFGRAAEATIGTVASSGIAS